jgi:hypothetical protein
MCVADLRSIADMRGLTTGDKLTLPQAIWGIGK